MVSVCVEGVRLKGSKLDLKLSGYKQTHFVSEGFHTTNERSNVFIFPTHAFRDKRHNYSDGGARGVVVSGWEITLNQ